MKDYIETIITGLVFIVLIGTGGFVCYHDKGSASACGGACHPIPMKSFDPTTGHCECQQMTAK